MSLVLWIASCNSRGLNIAANNGDSMDWLTCLSSSNFCSKLVTTKLLFLRITEEIELISKSSVFYREMFSPDCSFLSYSWELLFGLLFFKGSLFIVRLMSNKPAIFAISSPSNNSDGIDMIECFDNLLASSFSFSIANSVNSLLLFISCTLILSLNFSFKVLLTTGNDLFMNIFDRNCSAYSVFSIATKH